MRELFRSIMAEMQPFWFKPHHEEDKDEQLDEIIRANPWTPGHKRDANRLQRKIPQRPTTIGHMTRVPGSTKPRT